MAELVHTCPRCNANKVTFDVLAGVELGIYFSWQQKAEVFGVCRHCGKSTIFHVHETQKSALKLIESKGGFGHVSYNINDLFDIDGYVSSKDRSGVPAPEYLPPNIEVVFLEGATCMAVGCFNAAGTMFRLCLDLATKSFLPEENPNGLNSKIRRNLGFRLPWLFEHGYLPKSLEELASCVKEDGNDGAHEGTLLRADAEDLLDFTVAVLERLYTEPARVRIATERRAERRQPAS